MRWVRLLLWPGGVALGLAGESHLYGWGDTRHWIPDVAVGWTLIACGLVGWARRPESRAGALMVLTGVAWFAGNFSSQAVYVHRGALVQLVLTYPSGRARRWPLRAAVALGWIAAIVPGVWRSQTVTLALSALLLAGAGYAWARAAPRERRDRFAALAASAVIALLLAAGAALRLAWPTDAAANATLIAYQLGLGALAAALAVALVVRPAASAALTDLVVELGEGRRETVRGALAGALGDPTLEIGFVLAGRDGFVDDTGCDLELPRVGSDRGVTPVEVDGHAVAVLVHDPGALDDPALRAAVDAAARLGASNARLQARVRAQVAEVDASRRRLVRAGDEQRKRLEQRLREGAERRLATLRSTLEQARRDANGHASAEMLGRLEHVEAQLADTLLQLQELASGLHPRALAEHDLAGALVALATQIPVAVEIAVPERRFPTELEAAAYFVCSEGLANVVKYASAGCARIAVTSSDGSLVVEVADDGIGGADARRGSGLRGLGDRVEGLGGTLAVDSPPGAGTTLTARLPLRER